MNISCYNSIPQNAFAYWINKNLINCFKRGRKLNEIGQAKKGLSTGDNEKYLRFWYEVSSDYSYFTATDYIQAMYTGKKWFPINKGGLARKWYGNNDYVVNYQYNGRGLQKFNKAIIRNSNYYFQESLTWTDLTSGDISFRYNKCGFVHDVAGPCVFELNDNLYYVFGLLNSKVVNELLKFISPTLHYNIGTISELPILLVNSPSVRPNCIENVSISKKDWDSFEISWDFKKHPLI